jgi:WD40 repeat protein/energy-coupling factor transporter ATP-binding protein EcfA2
MRPHTTTQANVLNPFPGLRPFQMEESHLFFGREGQSDEVLLKLSRHRFVGVIGPSGSGKSSFIYCGVLPILYGGFLTDSSPDWQVVVTRPGGGPIENLAESILKQQPDYLNAPAEEQKIKRTIFTTLLRSSSLGLVEAILQTKKSPGINYLILVDQFEELFRFKDSTNPNSVNETLAFVNLLLEAANYPDVPIYVAITMRSDFIGECAQFPELTRKINDSHYLIPQLTREQKRRAIEGPVAVGGASITPRLVQQLLNDLGDNPDQLPILQHALMRTWNYWAAYRDYEDEPLDLKHYEAIGTMREALSMHANEAYDELTEEQQRICETLFKAITEKRGENFGIRRPTRLSEIAAIAGCTEEEVIEVIEKFREPGRSLLTPAYPTPLTGRSIVDISHESLMRIWTRLKNWVDDEADAVQMYLRLAEAAAMYQVGKAGLWRPPDLQLALNWLAKHKPTLIWGQRYHPAFERTMVFLEYSRKEYETEQRIRELEQKRKLQRIRTTAIVFAILTIVALLFLVYAFIQKAIADENYQLAESRRLEAEGLRRQAEAARDSARVERDNAIAARQAEEEQRKRAEENQRLAEQNAEEARRQKEEADRQRLRAQQNEQQAKTNEARALEQEKLANQNAEEALRQRYLAQARAMALKSLELGSEPELEGLLAQQAYNFNTTYGGEPYDNDIYNGLFYALRNFNHPLTESLKGHEYGAARALVTRMKDGTIYSGGSDGKIIRWTNQNGLWTGTEMVGARSDYQVYALDISPDENLLVAAGLNYANDNNNYIELYDLNNMKLVRKIPGFTKSVESVQFTPDGRGLYARDNGGRSIKFSDLSTSRTVITPPVKINAIELSADGTRLAGAGDNGTLYIWYVTRNYTVTEVKTGSASLTALSWHPTANQLITGSSSGQLRIVREGTIIRTLSGHKGPIEQIKYNHKATFFASASKDKTVRLWNTSRLTVPPIELRDHLDWVWALTFSPDDEQIMVGLHSAQQTIRQSKLYNEESIRAYPTVVERMAAILCSGDYLKRNMSEEEWSLYSGGLKKEKTCPNYP